MKNVRDECRLPFTSIFHSFLYVLFFVLSFVPEQLRGTQVLTTVIMKSFVFRDSVVVKALCYKPEGRGFDTR
jgi:hypothetical protein